MPSATNYQLLHLPSLLGRGIILERGGHFTAKTSRVRVYNPEYFSISLVVSGEGSWSRDDAVSQPVTAGISFSFIPGHRYDFGPHPGSSWEEYFVRISGKGTEAWAQEGLFEAFRDPTPLTRPTGIEALFKELFALPGDTAWTHLKATNIIERILIERMVQIDKPASADPLINDVCRHCQLHFDKAVSFEDLAAKHHVSYSFLRKRFKEVTGTSPAKHLCSLRIEHAQYLLRDSDANVAEIARECGFADGYVFSRNFRRTLGISPSQFRKDWLASTR